jgi:RNA polymerase sigma factor (sigma-70 family)
MSGGEVIGRTAGDDEVLARAQRVARQYFGGDERLLAELMEVYGTLVVGAARRVTRCNADVDDIVQETWLAFVKHHQSIADPSRIGAWLWTVALNKARRAQRIKNRLVVTADVDALRHDQTDVVDLDGLVCAAERRQALRHSVRSLSDKDRKLVELLLDSRDLDYRQISAISGRPVGSVGPTRERIIRKMRGAQPIAELLAAS